MKTLFRRAIGPPGPGGRDVVVAATERHDGDFHLRNTDPVALRCRQRAANRRVWAMVDQVHGLDVHVVDPSDSADRAAANSRCARADVIAASSAEIPIAVWAADCAPLVLLGERGCVVAAHGGWRGLAAGLVEVAVGEVGQRDDQVVAAVLGPVVHPCCYAFGANDLALVAAGLGMGCDAIAGETKAGAPALDVPAAVAGALDRHGIALDVVASCTACDDRWFSHRAGDAGRHAVVVWRDAAESGDGC